MQQTLSPHASSVAGPGKALSTVSCFVTWRSFLPSSLVSLITIWLNQAENCRIAAVDVQPAWVAARAKWRPRPGRGCRSAAGRSARRSASLRSGLCSRRAAGPRWMAASSSRQYSCLTASTTNLSSSGRFSCPAHSATRQNAAAEGVAGAEQRRIVGQGPPTAAQRFADQHIATCQPLRISRVRIHGVSLWSYHEGCHTRRITVPVRRPGVRTQICQLRKHLAVSRRPQRGSGDPLPACR